MNVYEKALALLGEEGENWIKESYEDRGKHCLVGALKRAQYGDAWHISTVPTSVKTVIMEQFCLPYGFESVESWNDEQERTFPDVRMVLEKCAVMEEEM
jgi:hypothetical protein